MLDAKLFLVYFLKTINIFNIDIESDTIDKSEVYCLAKNIYYESKGEDIQGQIAVAAVTMNRVNDPKFPKTVCDVVKFKIVSKITKKAVCAFSWYCEPDKGEKSLSFVNRDGTLNQRALEQFQIATMIAVGMLTGEIVDNTGGATHFHNPFTSNPDWKYTYRKTMRMGNHDFYKPKQ